MKHDTIDASRSICNSIFIIKQRLLLFKKKTKSDSQTNFVHNAFVSRPAGECDFSPGARQLSRCEGRCNPISYLPLCAMK